MTKKEIEDANVFIFEDKLTGKKSLIRVIYNNVSEKFEISYFARKAPKISKNTEKLKEQKNNLQNASKLAGTDNL